MTPQEELCFLRERHTNTRELLQACYYFIKNIMPHGEKTESALKLLQSVEELGLGDQSDAPKIGDRNGSSGQ